MTTLSRKIPGSGGKTYLTEGGIETNMPYATAILSVSLAGELD